MFSAARRVRTVVEMCRRDGREKMAKSWGESSPAQESNTWTSWNCLEGQRCGEERAHKEIPGLLLLLVQQGSRHKHPQPA